MTTVYRNASVHVKRDRLTGKEDGCLIWEVVLECHQ